MKNPQDFVLKTLRNNYLNYIKKGNGLFLVVTQEGGIEYISDYVNDILHLPPQKFIGKSIYEFIPSESHRYITKILSEIDNTHDTTLPIEGLVLYCIHCQRRYFDGVVMKESIGPNKYIFYLHEVTNHTLLEQQLQERNQELNAFVYKASHDLRSPILSVLGLISLMKTDISSSEAYIDMIHKSIHKMDNFITVLSEFTKNEYGANKYLSVNVLKFLQDIIDVHRYQTKAQAINFYIDVDPTLEICLDTFRLEIILNNLVSNAIKYHRHGSNNLFIKLEVKEIAEDQLEISVIDNGQGIHPKYVDRIFNMFERASEKPEGSGLGLYIVKKAIEKLKGNIEVYSTFGEGSSFKVIFQHYTSECRKFKKVMEFSEPS